MSEQPSNPKDLTIKIHKCHLDGQSEERDIEARTKHGPIVELDEQLLDQTTGHEVACVRVLQEGKYVNFWVRVGKNRQGRVVCEVATNVADRTVRKSVQAGAWRCQN